MKSSTVASISDLDTRLRSYLKTHVPPRLRVQICDGSILPSRVNKSWPGACCCRKGHGQRYKKSPVKKIFARSRIIFF